MQGDARNLPFEDASMELVTMLDVLEHISESDAALQEVHRVIKKSGLYLLPVPALQFLYSPHDRDHHHVRDTTKRNYALSLLEMGLKHCDAPTLIRGCFQLKRQ